MGVGRLSDREFLAFEIYKLLIAPQMPKMSPAAHSEVTQGWLRISADDALTAADVFFKKIEEARKEPAPES